MPADEKKFVPVMLTPYAENMQIDFQRLSILVDFYIEAGAKGLFANCLSSEMYSLTADEQLQLITHIIKYVNGRVPVVATGSFGLASRDKAAFIKKVYETGVDAVVLVTSHFAEQEESDEMLLQRIEEVLYATANIPLGLYECPAPYKRTLAPGVLKKMVETDRFIYHKDTSIDFEKVKDKLSAINITRLQFFDAHSPNAINSLRAGARGMSCIAGNFYPEIIVWLCDNVLRDEKKEIVEWLQSEISKVDPILHQLYPVSAKYFLRKRGLDININSRVCPLALTSLQKQALDDVYNNYLEWCVQLGIEKSEPIVI